MIIDFSKMEAAIVPNFKGGEKEYVVKTHLDEQNRIMHGTLHPGASIGMHMHERNSETYFIISGKGHIVMDDGTEEDFGMGQMHYCPMGHGHSLINNADEDLVFIGIVSEHHE